MRRIIFLLIMFQFGLAKLAIFAQPSTPATDDGTELHLRSSLVFVPAMVRAKSGDLVFTLKASDFVVTDNGVPQKINLEEETGRQPLALVIVMEVGGAGAREFDRDRYLPLYKMLETLVGAAPHKIAVVSFDSQARLAQPFTSSVDETVASISDLTPGCSRQHHTENCQAPGSFHDLSDADNGGAILDGLGFAIDLLRSQGEPYRRAILLISETRDRGSNLQMEAAVREFAETNTTIYSVGFSTGKSEAIHYAYRNLPGSHRSSNPPHGCMGKELIADPDAPQTKAGQAYDCFTELAPPLALAKMLFIVTENGLRRNVPREVAQLTGGEYFKLTDAKSLEHDLATISNHLPNRYMLSFKPMLPEPGFHAVSVSLPDHPDLNVTARTGYWAEETVK